MLSLFQDLCFVLFCPRQRRAFRTVAAVFTNGPKGRSGGTGFVAAKGWLATAAHVLEGASTVTVNFGRNTVTVPAASCLFGLQYDVAFVPVPGHWPVATLACDLPHDPNNACPKAWLLSAHPRADGTSQKRAHKSMLTLRDMDEYIFHPPLKGHRSAEGAVMTGHQPRKGDSGSPVVGADGTVYGLMTASFKGGLFRTPTSKRWLPLYSAGLMLPAPFVAFELARLRALEAAA